MAPKKAVPDPKRGFIITHVCEKCGYTGRNKAVPEAKVQPDNMDLLIRLTVAEY